MNLNLLPAEIKRGMSAATYPLLYQQARSAIQQCASVDECKGWEDKMAAIQTYARQVKDSSLFDAAAKIKARAQRRLGELLDENYPEKRHVDIARATGLTQPRVRDSILVAAVPEEKFEAALETSPVPTSRKIHNQHHMDELRADPAYVKELREEESATDDDHAYRAISNRIEVMMEFKPADMARIIGENSAVEEWEMFAEFVNQVANLLSRRKS